MVAHPSTTISPSSAAGATAPESLLARYISAHVRKGEQAEERANQAREKVEQHFIAAGARQIIENVTGFFSILHECRVPKIPAPGMIAGSDWRRCGMARRGCRLPKEMRCLHRSAVAVLRAGRTHLGAQFDERDRYRR